MRNLPWWETYIDSIETLRWHTYIAHLNRHKSSFCICLCVYQAGRLLIRKLVCERMGYAWDGFRLERTARGKPYLPRLSPATGPASSHTHWNFNVSHQGDYAVLAAEPRRQVGVDVMKTSKPGTRTEHLIHRGDPFPNCTRPFGCRYLWFYFIVLSFIYFHAQVQFT